MKQLAVVSGKGGTGKTTISATLFHLANNVALADCDVDAPNLHLVIDSVLVAQEDFMGSKVAEINPSLCNQCGKCVDYCRFDAIEKFIIQDIKCEGCGTCRLVCPEGAIKLINKITGKVMLSETGLGSFSHAALNIGADGSGKLVTDVRKQSLKFVETDTSLIIIDGSPGVGCPVMASVTGTDLALIITEPTQSGLHDLNRLSEVIEQFGIKACVCVNKYDLNPTMTKEIESFCLENNIEVVGKVPHDENFAMFQREVGSNIKFGNSPAGQAILGLWENLKQELEL